jgi:hypothetical protein
MTDDERKRAAYVIGRGGKGSVGLALLYAAWVEQQRAIDNKTITIEPVKMPPTIDQSRPRRWIPPTVRERRRR